VPLINAELAAREAAARQAAEQAAQEMLRRGEQAWSLWNMLMQVAKYPIVLFNWQLEMEQIHMQPSYDPQHQPTL
jgi:hypothetical protein